VEPDFARDIGGWMKAFFTGKTIVSAGLGLAAGVLLGMLIRRRD
jgi:MYXO-CTERM domain-containing protein